MVSKLVRIRQSGRTGNWGATEGQKRNKTKRKRAFFSILLERAVRGGGGGGGGGKKIKF